MKKYFIFLIVFFIWNNSSSQGCVALRNLPGINSHLLFEYDQPGKLFLNIGNRYFEASETYRGEEFITDTLVKNKLYTLNLTATKIIMNGWSITLTLPIGVNSRENSSDHGGPKTPKYTTRSYGLGDIRLSMNTWLLDPKQNRNLNIQLGLGIKFPSGDYAYTDYFTRNDSTEVLAPVDQAIQLGDGGLGIGFELNSFFSLTKSIRLFANGFYLANPKEQNGTSNLKGRYPTEIEISNNTTVMSVPDQVSARGGVSFEFQKLAISAAIKYEKIPVNDLFGGNRGFRRAASITSLEPGISYQLKKTLLYLNVGIPINRNIVLNHQNNRTPAGFADYVFSFGAGFRL